MTKLLAALSAILCLGCSPPPQAAAPVSPASVEAVRTTGPYAVGVSEGPDDTLIFYPAVTTGAPWTPAATDARREGLTRRFGAGAAEALSAARTTASEEAGPAPGRFPLVIFQPGAGVGSVEYRLLLEDLTSRGFIVLPLHAQTSPPAGEARYPEAAREFLAALQSARGGDPSLVSADASRPVFVGHSLGGAAAVVALSETPGGLAVNLDGDLVQAPRVATGSALLYMIGRNPSESDRSRARRAAVWREVSAGQADAVALQIGDMGHFDFSDAALVKSGVSETRRVGRFGPIDGAEAQALTADLVGAFLESRVKTATDVWPAALARRPQATSPTVW